MNAFDLLGSLSPDKRQSVYFLYGPERFFVTEIVERLTGMLVTAENRDFNLETLDGAATKPADWVAAARTLSFFGGDKLVVVHGVDEAAWDDAGQQAILDYVDRPVAESCLVMTAQKADRKRKLYKSLCALPGAVECSAPREEALAPWLKQRAKARGYDLSVAAAKRMVDRVGAKPGRLAVELEKVMTYAGAHTAIGEAEVAAVVGEVRLETVFALTDALRDKNPGRALGLLRNQIGHGEEPLKLLGTIAWQFRLIWEVKHHQKQRLPAARIAAALGQKPFLIEKAMRFTGNFSERQLREGFRSLAWADRELKTTGKDPEGVMESLVLKLCAGGV